ncbi:hypothetical protein [Pseudomonas nitroreducens]|uniref:hypothetical protein n=1 Tax=Pseudomonas nitroreducens TaxID=46680 RepID=UPI0037FBE284
MTIRDKLAKPSPIETPYWLEDASDTTKELYNSAQREFTKLSHLISSGANIRLKERKINQTAVARNAKKDKSILSSRRQPELMEWIKQKNQELADLLVNHQRSFNKPKSKSSLRSEISTLKEVNNRATIEGLRLFVEKVLSSDLLNDRDSLARENLSLKNKIDDLNNKVANLQEACNNQAIQIAKLKKQKSKAALTVVPDNNN